MMIGMPRENPALAVGAGLLESMVVLVIVAILLALAVPGMKGVLADAKRDNWIADVVASIQLARTEAMKRSSRVSVCPSSDGTQCNGSAHWEAGWIVFHDPNSNGVVDVDEPIIRAQSAIDGEGTIWGARKRVTFHSHGFCAGFNDTLNVCDYRGAREARRVIISNLGRVRVVAGVIGCP
ncbi:general secretion pathway protein GspH [Parasulfuritortus cantonensis]|uniref:Type II secretion system protein H n=1 Tax=Parasulfuritortus cantonensis TaxID=2528202 RepID=A0A4R1BCM3_9PROT|nr:GspH/FimT family pseudopilin [Parasulfuritortus cantonensis]TCJ14764.1 general secretion pathway protein GspH [Parasulfuritortus cantonensis]